MITIVLDTKIYDKLEADQAMVEQINQLIASKAIDILVRCQVAECLARVTTNLIHLTITNRQLLEYLLRIPNSLSDSPDGRHPRVLLGYPVPPSPALRLLLT